MFYNKNMEKFEVAKIVGASNGKNWCQVHNFRPVDEKLKTHGQLTAVLAFKAKKENIEVTSFGTEIIQRLQEIYYSNESESVLKKLSQTIESLAAEFIETVELDIVMTVLWKKLGEVLLYAGRNQKGQVFLKRDEQIVSLLTGETEELMVVSGKLEKNDTIVLGTAQLFKILSEESLSLALSQATAEAVVENLAPLVHEQEKNSRAAGAIIKRESSEEDEQKIDEEKIEEDVKDENEPVLKSGRKQMLKQWLGNIKERLSNRGVGVKLRTTGKKKSTATIVIVLLIVFSVSLVLAGRKRQVNKTQKQYEQLMDEAKYKYEEGVNLTELNPLRSKSLLKEVQEILEAEEVKELKLSGSQKKAIEELKKKVEESLSQVQREYAIEEADEWFDFDLTKEGFRGRGWDNEENKLMVIGEDGSMLSLNLETKASEIVISGDEVKGLEQVGMAGKRAFGVDDDQAVVVEVSTGEAMQELEEEWGRVEGVRGFSSNLYVLQATKEGQIWRYLGLDSGLSSKKAYLKGDKYDLSEAVDMAIDGSVWVLFSDGTIAKYTRGVKDSFVVAGLDKGWGEVVKIFTDAEQENLYVLDRQSTKVVVVNKSGEYQSQYNWPGIAGVKDLVVNEKLGKIFLLTGEKVFTIELRN